VATHTSTKRTWIWAISGLAEDGVNHITPMALATNGVDAQPAVGVSVFEGTYRALVARVGGDFRQALDGGGSFPVSGQSRDLSGSVTFVLDDRTAPEIARFFLATSATRKPLTTVGPTVSWTPTSAELYLAGQDGIAVNDVLYCQRQAFRVVTLEPGSGRVLVRAQIPSPTSPGSMVAIGTSVASQPVGHFGTWRGAISAAQSPEPPFSDNRVYKVNPFIRGREVLLYVRDGDDPLQSEQVYARMVIDGSPTVNETGTEVTIKLRGILGLIGDRKLNTDAVTYRAIIGTQETRDATGDAINVGAQLLKTGGGLAVWRKSAVRVVQIKDSILAGVAVSPVDASSSQAEIQGIANLTVVERSNVLRQPWLSDPLPTDGGHNASELLVSAPLDAAPINFGNAMDATAHPLYCSDLSRVADHPLEMVLQFLGALPSNLPDHWRCSVPSSWVDVDDVLRLANNTYGWARPWPGEVWGHDGKPVKAMDVLTGMMRPLFCAFAFAPDGRLTVTGLADFETDETLGVDRVLPGRSVSIDQSNTVDALVMRTGVSFADDEIAHTVRADDGFGGVSFPYSDSTITIDAPGLMHPDTPIGAGIRFVPSVAAMIESMTSIAQLFRYSLPVYDLEVTGASKVHAGRVYTFRAYGLRDAETGLTDLGPLSFSGYVTSSTEDIGRAADALTQRVTVLRLPFTLSAIGPAGDIASARNTGGDTSLGLTPMKYIDPVTYTVRGAAYTKDVQQFAVGQECMIIDKNGAQKTQTFEIGAISEVDSTLTAVGIIALVGSGSYSSGNHAAGDTIVLADYADAIDADTAVYTWLAAGYGWAV
jgi:hypothetical protein